MDAPKEHWPVILRYPEAISMLTPPEDEELSDNGPRPEPATGAMFR